MAMRARAAIRRSMELVICVALLAPAAGPAQAQSALPTTQEFHGAVATCALGLDVTIGADLVGSIASIYNGQRSTGAASFRTATTFLQLFPESERTKVYELYTRCIARLVGVSPVFPAEPPSLPAETTGLGVVCDELKGGTCRPYLAGQSLVCFQPELVARLADNRA